MKNFRKWYVALPRELRVFVEYILPSAIITAAIDYFGGLEAENEYVMGAINILLIFLRQAKPRIQALRK